LAPASRKSKAQEPMSRRQSVTSAMVTLDAWLRAYVTLVFAQMSIQMLYWASTDHYDE
jgi:hypothetical protein